jgi:hypothetical protein
MKCLRCDAENCHGSHIWSECGLSLDLPCPRTSRRWAPSTQRDQGNQERRGCDGWEFNGGGAAA